MDEDPRILLVEDDPDVRRVLVRYLTQIGCVSIQEAETNSDAREILKRFHPSAVITDINHPGERGNQLFLDLRSDPRTSDVPIIVCTGYPNLELELEMWRAGVDDFLYKPVTASALAQSLSKVLRGRGDPDTALLRLGVETADLDYKESFDWGDKSCRAELARDALAMSNHGGGTIIFGVAEPSPGRFSPVGISPTDAKHYETTKLNDALRKYLGGVVSIAVRLLEFDGKLFAIARIQPDSDTVAMAAAQNENAGLFRGRIYVRTQDARTAELQDGNEVRRLIDRLVDRRIRRLATLQPGWFVPMKHDH